LDILSGQSSEDAAGNPNVTALEKYKREWIKRAPTTHSASVARTEVDKVVEVKGRTAFVDAATEGSKTVKNFAQKVRESIRSSEQARVDLAAIHGAALANQRLATALAAALGQESTQYLRVPNRSDNDPIQNAGDIVKSLQETQRVLTMSLAATLRTIRGQTAAINATAELASAIGEEKLSDGEYLEIVESLSQTHAGAWLDRIDSATADLGEAMRQVDFTSA
jgi:hypothetical protein